MRGRAIRAVEASATDACRGCLVRDGARRVLGVRQVTGG